MKRLRFKGMNGLSIVDPILGVAWIFAVGSHLYSTGFSSMAAAKEWQRNSTSRVIGKVASDCSVFGASNPRAVLCA